MHDSTGAGYAGVDWAIDAHAVCVVDAAGRVIVEFDVTHSAEGLSEMCRLIDAAGARRVAIERPDRPVVDAVLGAGLEVVRGRQPVGEGAARALWHLGNKSDRSDAYVLADCLRTDGHRWRSLEPDGPATITLRSHVRARKDLARPESRPPTNCAPPAHRVPRRCRPVPRHRQPDLVAVPRAVPVGHMR